MIYCRLYNIKRQIPKPLKIYYPGQNEENDDNSVRIASILAKCKGELNIQSKCHENENSITHFKSSVEGTRHTAIM